LSAAAAMRGADPGRGRLAAAVLLASALARPVVGWTICVGNQTGWGYGTVRCGFGGGGANVCTPESTCGEPCLQYEQFTSLQCLGDRPATLMVALAGAQVDDTVVAYPGIFSGGSIGARHSPTLRSPAPARK
jgi:hypothetical protein